MRKVSRTATLAEAGGDGYLGAEPSPEPGREFGGQSWIFFCKNDSQFRRQLSTQMSWICGKLVGLPHLQKLVGMHPLILSPPMHPPVDTNRSFVKWTALISCASVLLLLIRNILQTQVQSVSNLTVCIVFVCKTEGDWISRGLQNELRSIPETRSYVLETATCDFWSAAGWRPSNINR